MSKNRATMIILLLVVFAGSSFIAANVILTKRHQLADTTNVLGVSTNGDYDVKLVNLQQTNGKTYNGNDIRRVTASVTIANLSSETLQIAPGLQFFVSGASGTLYPLTARYLAPGATIGGPLQPKTTMPLVIDFDIPANDVPNSLTFQATASKPIVKINL